MRRRLSDPCSGKHDLSWDDNFSRRALDVEKVKVAELWNKQSNVMTKAHAADEVFDPEEHENYGMMRPTLDYL
ncbi:hypothetical protein DFQ28_002704 [Apophysomyces sp. BC1034]|nr:hypothetical protein DFQ30_003647 [Apophysomyces sp. BC1015]KAG0164559.1 hypothetical protein DFQ29_002172 [Apophysomyces sp. BC1021]KAG0180884.1 hypothetical protein DFQ28_002704 [Apophysomyces sp. BC1034]